MTPEIHLDLDVAKNRQAVALRRLKLPLFHCRERCKLKILIQRLQDGRLGNVTTLINLNSNDNRDRRRLKLISTRISGIDSMSQSWGLGPIAGRTYSRGRRRREDTHVKSANQSPVKCSF